MAAVFMSHSSQDKPFVRKLAAALLAEGIPVWLDSWELEVGDSLQSRIQRGIVDSSLFVLTISQQSIESGWVEKEVRVALEHESSIGRKFIFPVKIDDCAPPGFITERIYADFKSGFSGPLRALVDALERGGARSLIPDADQEVICLAFTKQTNLDRAAFLRNIRSFCTRHPGQKLLPSQIKVIDDPDYVALKQRLHARIDRVETDRWWSPALEQELKSIPARVRQEEEVMVKGVASIVNSEAGAWVLCEALHWFLKFTRSRLCYDLYQCQYPDPSALPYGKECRVVSGFDDMARFYDVKKLIQVDAWTSKYRPKHETVYVGAEQLRDEELRERVGIPYAGGLEDFFLPEAFSRYVLPQALYGTLRWGTHEEDIWRQEDVIVGPH
jgi:TIR domain